MAYNINYFDGIICPIIDAKNDNVYFSSFEIKNEHYNLINNYTAESIFYLIDTFSNSPKNILFVGDGVDVYKDKLLEALNKRCFFAPVHLNSLKSSSIAKAAWDKLINKELDDNNLSPLYLRKSQAERMLDLNESNKNS